MARARLNSCYAGRLRQLCAARVDDARVARDMGDVARSRACFDYLMGVRAAVAVMLTDDRALLDAVNADVDAVLAQIDMRWAS